MFGGASGPHWRGGIVTVLGGVPGAGGWESRVSCVTGRSSVRSYERGCQRQSRPAYDSAPTATCRSTEKTMNDQDTKSTRMCPEILQLGWHSDERPLSSTIGDGNRLDR